MSITVDDIILQMHVIIDSADTKAPTKITALRLLTRGITDEELKVTPISSKRWIVNEVTKAVRNNTTIDVKIKHVRDILLAHVEHHEGKAIITIQRR